MKKTQITRQEMKELIAALRDVIACLPTESVADLKAMESAYIEMYGDDLLAPKTTFGDLIGKAMDANKRPARLDYDLVQVG